MPRINLDEIQRQMLQSVQKDDPHEIIRALTELLDRYELPADQLDLEWLDLWEKNKEYYAHRLLPRSIMEKLSEIQGCDKKIEKLSLTSDDNVCILLGAGASAPKPSSIPTVNQLLPELWHRARRLGRDEIDRLIEWCNEHKIENIEDLLTAAYIANFTAKNTAVTGLLDFFLFQKEKRRLGEEEYLLIRKKPSLSQVDTGSIALLQDTLQILFGLLTGTMIPADPNAGHEALVSFLRNHPRTSIITTNYDGCVDEALLKADLPINTYIRDEEPADTSVNLIKIHGSINWSYCDSCHDVREFDLIKIKRSYVEDTLSYAVIGICKKCQGQRRPLLIPPLGLKFIMFPSLIRLWDAARTFVEQAKILVVVGYSFSEADTYINKIIERSMTINEKQYMVVCDTDSALVTNLRKRFAARIDGFDENRILRAVGSADKMLPQVLEMLLGSSAKKAQSSSRHKSGARSRKSKRTQSNTIANGE